MKWLIVTGDDFGMTSGINRGIVDAHRDGILTSASVLVNRSASDEAAVVKAELPGFELRAASGAECGRARPRPRGHPAAARPVRRDRRHR
jgi:YdjC-like protein